MMKVSDIIKIYQDEYILDNKFCQFKILDNNFRKKLLKPYNLDLLKKYNCRIKHYGMSCSVRFYDDFRTHKKDNLNKCSWSDITINELSNDFKTKLFFEQFKEKKKEKKVKRQFSVKRIDNLMTARAKVFDYVRANAFRFNAFITLTYADNEQNLEKSYDDFKKWTKKMRYLDNKFCYLCVPEFQKRGAIHYHVICYIAKKSSCLRKTMLYQSKVGCKVEQIQCFNWCHGISRVDFFSRTESKNLQAISLYVAKYITKDSDKRLYSHHSFLRSDNLYKVLVEYVDLSATKACVHLSKVLKQFKKLLSVYRYDGQYHHGYCCFTDCMYG